MRTMTPASGQTAGGSAPVFIGGNAKLGTVAPSARRFKDGIRDLADLTKKLNGLRVVSYRYTPEVTGSSESPLEFGLIAEEVAKSREVRRLTSNEVFDAHLDWCNGP